MMNPSFKRKDRGKKCYFSSCFMFSRKRLFISFLTRGIIKTIYFSKGLERSCRRNIFFTLSIAFLSLAHLIFSYFYIRMYGYFNLHGHLNSFMTVAWLLRFVIDAYIVICGFFAVREERYKVLPFYLLFFLFNLVLPFIFHI